MAEQRVQRRLAAILAADVVGYSRMMREDEAGTLAQLKTLRKELLDPKVEEYGGRIVKTTGDGTLIEFPSAVDAVQYASDVQRAIRLREANGTAGTDLTLRIGINVGDIIVEGDDIFGDGVNVAARLEGLAEPGGVCLSGDVYRQVRGKVEAVFVDLGEQSVKNLAEPIQVYGLDFASTASVPTVALEVDKVLTRPSVAVLPFENLSGESEQEYFADGLTEDIITALSRWRSFPVIARNSTFAYKGQSPDVREVGRQLGARYVLEGSVRKGGDRVRVTAQLIDAQTGHHVWAERYDRDLRDIFAVQDELTQGIAALVMPELQRVEHKRLIALTPQHLDAYDCVLQGLACLNAINEPDNERAQELFQRAIELDPKYGRAYAGLAFAQHRDSRFEFASLTDHTLPQALDNARHAVQLDGADYLAHWILGIILVRTGELELGLTEAIRSVELNPSSGYGFSLVGLAFTLLGRPEDALPNFDKAHALIPDDPRLSMVMGYTALGHFTARHYDAAVEWARRALQRQPDDPEAYLNLAAALGQLGQMQNAGASLDACERLRPGYLDRRHANGFRFKQEKDNEHFLDGLRKAGLPE